MARAPETGDGDEENGGTDLERQLGDDLAAAEERLDRATREIAALTRRVVETERVLERARRAAGEGMRFDMVALRLPYLGRIPWIARQAMKRRARRIVRAGLFDPEFYLAQYPDIAEAGADPARHYLRSGWREGRAPRAELLAGPAAGGGRR